ncbi:hypothetical protein AVEN_128193-1 [Araneus ventricosus]|uniref:Uncharacterized protein n=1 Tax=Araneus ventricosus TaxID=182803 RepID=A0A4Y2A0X8_ARAVE|nr:hypothetical protein AVEN_128193-1 [Araneus ventricosus]
MLKRQGDRLRFLHMAWAFYTGVCILASRTVRDYSNPVGFSANTKGFVVPVGTSSYVVRRFPRTFNEPARSNPLFQLGTEVKRAQNLNASKDPLPPPVTTDK